MRSTFERWRGLNALVADAVENGARAVERVHRETSRRPFDVLSWIPLVARPSQAVRLVHDTTVAGVYATIRLSARLVATGVDALLEAKGGARSIGTRRRELRRGR